MQYPHLRFRIMLEACNKAIGLRILRVVHQHGRRLLECS